MYLFSHIDPFVRLAHVSLVALSAWDFIDSLAFQVNLRFRTGKNVDDGVDFFGVQ